MFEALLNHPPINQIIVLEDGISVIEDNEEALAKYCAANESTRTLIFEECKNLDLVQSAENLKSLFTFVSPFLEDAEKQTELLDKGISKYAEVYNIEKVGEIIKTLKGAYNTIKEIFKRKGIADYTSDYGLFSLSDIINNTPITISIFDSASDFDAINNLAQNNKDDFSKWTLLLVDKKLKAGDDGVALARGIIEKCLNENIPITSVVYTSTFSVKQPIEKVDFFLIEVSKSSESILEELSNSLSKSAYVFVYNHIARSYRQATDDALKLVINNSENIFNLINENVIEGFSSLEAILDNFSLSHSFKLNQLLFGSSNDYFNLSIGFKKEFYNSAGLSQSSSDLNEINSFEIFDYKVNEKLLPIDNGDVFIINKQYYILSGQTCDLSIRDGDNQRKNRHAELIPAKFQNENTKDKFSTHLSPSERRVEIGFFRTENNEIGKLKLSINDQKYCDFKILDLCAFNRTGVSNINLIDKSVEKDVKRFIPQRLNYYLYLKQYISKLIVLDSKLEEFALNDINEWNYELDQSKTNVTWQIKRICRIKGGFSSALYSEFINHKQRLALNLILPVATKNVIRKINIGLPSNILGETFHINSWESGGKEFLKRDEIFVLLNKTELKIQKFIQLPEKIEFKITRDYELKINEDDSLELTLPFYCESTKKAFKKHMVNGSELGFTDEELISVNGDSLNMTRINLLEIGAGLKIKDSKKILMLVGGIISIKDE